MITCDDTRRHSVTIATTVKPPVSQLQLYITLDGRSFRQPEGIYSGVPLVVRAAHLYGWFAGLACRHRYYSNTLQACGTFNANFIKQHLYIDIRW